MFTEDDVIYAYSRAQAIADGVLVDVTETAKEAGFRFPVAMTRTVWGQYVEIPEGVEGQDERGRLWDILVVLRFAIGRGDSVAEAARRLGLNQNLLRNEKQALEAPGPHAWPGHGQLSPFEKENRRLRAENKRLLAERDLLKQAAAFFAQEAT